MPSFKKSIPLLLTFLSWFAIIAQVVLIIQNRTLPVGQTIIRFFSNYTILTNIVVAFSFTMLISQGSKIKRLMYRADTMTGITVYIVIVGLVYNVLLRYLWRPKGFQIVVDELLYTIIPLLCLNFWWEFVSKKRLKYQWAFPWLIYPLVFLIFTLIQGESSGYYPYPFLDVNLIGYQKVFINSAMLTGCFLTLSWILIAIARKRSSKERNNSIS